MESTVKYFDGNEHSTAIATDMIMTQEPTAAPEINTIPKPTTTPEINTTPAPTTSSDQYTTQAPTATPEMTTIPEPSNSTILHVNDTNITGVNYEVVLGLTLPILLILVVLAFIIYKKRRRFTAELISNNARSEVAQEVEIELYETKPKRIYEFKREISQ